MRILAFFAHPDDETMFLGGTFAYLCSSGAEIHFICATRGEGGEMGDPPICARSELGEIREKELTCAVNSLGGKSLDFLDFKDPLVGPEGELYAFSQSAEEVAHRLNQHLMKIQPDVVIAHGPAGEYGHPGHILANQGMITALEGIPDLNPIVYAPSWLSRETGEFIPTPSILVDIEPWVEDKLRAVYCHRSQHDLFLRHGKKRAGRPVDIPEMIRTQEAISKIYSNDQNQGDPLEKLLINIAIPLPEHPSK